MKKSKYSNKIMVKNNRKKSIIGAVFPFLININFVNKH